MIAAIVGAAVLLAGLLVTGFISSPAPPLDDSVAGESQADGLQSVAPTPGATTTGAAAARSGAAKRPASGQEIKDLLQQRLDNPLNHLRSPGYHSVQITATSSETMPIVGYLVPTGSDAYGARKKTASFSLSQRAYGPGYLAAVFIQAGQTGAPVTCRVTVDGKTTNTEATSGPYGRAVCIG